MRVSTQALYRGIERRLLTLADQLNRSEEKVATGRNMNRPSDNPVGLVSALGLRNSLSRLEQYQRNMDMGKIWLDLSSTAIEQAGKVAQQAQAIALNLQDGTQSAEMRSTLANEVGLLLDQAVSLGNTQLAGKYIFAGYNTNTQPFTKTQIGGSDAVQYNGDGNDFQIQVGPQESLEIGKNGQELFIDSDFFDSLIRLKQAIENNDPTAIQQEATRLQGVEDFFNAQVSDIGIRQSRILEKQDILKGLKLNFQNQIDDLENADMTQAILEVQERQNAYEVALAASSKIMEVSLLDYLR
ncbi:MAG: flagellar hook-associated protein 3 [Deltaproteobacteria bacterium]|nr:MAG: flagellar hook-associated protein 3 [Deltaproteobacteria bacterium]